MKNGKLQELTLSHSGQGKGVRLVVNEFPDPVALECRDVASGQVLQSCVVLDRETSAVVSRHIGTTLLLEGGFGPQSTLIVAHSGYDTVEITAISAEQSASLAPTSGLRLSKGKCLNGSRHLVRVSRKAPSVLNSFHGMAVMPTLLKSSISHPVLSFGGFGELTQRSLVVDWDDAQPCTIQGLAADCEYLVEIVGSENDVVLSRSSLTLNKGELREVNIE
jgi:hypothetical protein